MTKRPRVIITMPVWLNEEVERLRIECPEFHGLSKSKVLYILTQRGLDEAEREEKRHAQDDH